MDFMNDSSQNQRYIRTFNVINNFNREALGIHWHCCQIIGW
ncbi:hypothetical protein GAPWKB11_0168 [Gilliamella apicola]|nr:hypothetical protein GAPWKB11_0168 [Gilliamella apicola]